jgi:hypothetical protein
MSLFLIIVSCNKHSELIVKNLTGKEVNIFHSNKEKIILITNQYVCHDCIINLDDYIAKKYNLKNYDYILLTIDSQDIPSRRIALETYKNDYTPDIQNVFFTREDSIIQQKLNIPHKLFNQYTPYLVYVDLNKKPHYFGYKDIFEKYGKVKEGFAIN